MAHNGMRNGSHTNQSYFEENKRCYDSFRKGKYMFPCDQEEMNRLDIFHKLITIARANNGQNGLYQHELPKNPRIIDLGCGSGIWAVDMADRCGPDAEILGWDLTLHQPMLIPQGLRFEQRDFEEYWIDVEPDSRDLIRGQMLLGSVSKWDALYRQTLRHLKPGTGIFEQIEIDFCPILEEGDLPADSKLLQWSRELRGAMEQVGRSIEMDPNTKAVLESVGYVDVQYESKRIPYNTWPSDTHDKLLGRWFNLGMTQGIAALSLAPFTRVNGYAYERIMEFLDDVKREMCDRRLRAYCMLHIYTARRPAA